MNTRILPISGISTNAYKRVPCLKLQGIWLKKLGLKIGRKINIGENEGLLVITVAPVEGNKEVAEK